MSFEAKLKRLFDRKKELQEMQALQQELREQWQETGAVIRSLGQEISQKQEELLESI